VWEKVDRYSFVLTVHNLLLPFPREGDDWLMARFIAAGYGGEDLLTLNRVRKHQQVLFLSDILGASGGLLDKRYLEMRRVGEWWSSIKFPRKVVNASEMGLWRRATAQVVAQGAAQASLGRLKIGGHKQWEWRVQESKGRLYRQHKKRAVVYKHVQRGRYVHHRTSRSGRMEGEAATVEKVTPGVWKVCSVITCIDWPEPAKNFIDVLKGWGHTWLWDDLKITGGTAWIAKAIDEGTLLAVADGLYIREHHPELCAAAFILECTRHRGMLVGSFLEASKAANAFQGELLGLMAIHLLLLAVNTVSPGLTGRVKIFLDCLGALGCTAELPPYRIPTRCKHSDVLKTILVNCGGLSFHREYIHVEAHQNDLMRWEKLSREAQLNAACDAGAKEMLRL
jgi:hypothetical protein